MVYFAHHAGVGVIKIGYTINLPSRLDGLRTDYGPMIRVIAVMPGRPFDEYALHTQFASDRATGEWFWPSARLEAFIRRHAAPWDGAADWPSRGYPAAARMTWGRRYLVCVAHVPRLDPRGHQHRFTGKDEAGRPRTYLAPIPLPTLPHRA